MAAGETGCDGCGRTLSPEDSTTVVLPNGDRVTCCPRCEPHARAVADGDAPSLDQRRDTCDGCRSTVLASELEDVVLEDGTVLACCPSCAAQAPDKKRTTDGSDGIGDDDDETEAGDGGTGAEASEIGDPDTTATATTTTTTSTTAQDQPTDRTRCSQCRTTVAAELFRVTTVDGRTERFCRSCKEEAKADGIVKDVEMRATRARDVLGVDEDATAEEIQTAYHQQVKRAHPDRKSGSRSAFQLVTDAYERLRREYSGE